MHALRANTAKIKIVLILFKDAMSTGKLRQMMNARVSIYKQCKIRMQLSMLLIFTKHLINKMSAAEFIVSFE